MTSPQTLPETCARILPDDGDNPRVRTRWLCGAPARWLCVENRQRYCDQHAHHNPACCQLVETGATP